MLENIPPCSRKKGCFCTFNDFKTFVQLSFPSLPQISTSFPNHAFRNAHFSRVRAFQQGKPPLYFVACYYAQYRMRSAILRNHLKAPSANIVSWLLNQLDAKRATGLDRIPCKLLKLSSSIVGPSLAYIFKSCIGAEIFPNEWKIAKVIPLFKKGSKRELGNYRPL